MPIKIIDFGSWANFQRQRGPPPTERTKATMGVLECPTATKIAYYKKKNGQFSHLLQFAPFSHKCMITLTFS